jgi:hypothetical protein
VESRRKMSGTMANAGQCPLGHRLTAFQTDSKFTCKLNVCKVKPAMGVWMSGCDKCDSCPVPAKGRCRSAGQTGRGGRRPAGAAGGRGWNKTAVPLSQNPAVASLPPVNVSVNLPATAIDLPSDDGRKMLRWLAPCACRHRLCKWRSGRWSS